MNFFTNTLDPMIALPLIAVLEIFVFLLVGAWTDQKVLLWKRVRNKTI